MPLGERIKQIRKEKGLTQQALGDRIGVKQNTIALIESGKRNTSDQLLISICREFNVNETWLRTGEGEMLRKQSREDELATYMNSLLQSEPDDIRRRFATAVSHLSTQQLELLESIALQLAEDLHVTESQAALAAPQKQRSELVSKSVDELDDEDADLKAAARKQAEAYYEQLLLEASTRTSGASTPAKAG